MCRKLAGFVKDLPTGKEADLGNQPREGQEGTREAEGSPRETDESSERAEPGSRGNGRRCRN